MSTEPFERFIDLHGAFNVRDLGGYPGAGGATVRWRRVFRADGPERLTHRDRDVVDGLGIGTVIDLRSAREGSGAVWEPAQGGSRHTFSVIDVLPDYATLPPLHRPEDLGARYLVRFENGGAALVDAVRLIAGNLDAPVLFHCAAGKDRTGILAAVLLEALGVPDEVVVEDYALSHEPHHRKIAVVQADPRPGDSDYAAMPEVLKGARPEAMATFLRLVRERHGSLVDGLRGAGLSDETVERLREGLLER